MPALNLSVLALDFESFYSQEYSLRKMTPVEYVCGDQFEVIGAGCRMDRFFLPMPPPASDREWISRAVWLDRDQLPALLAKVDWSKTALLSHNVAFDGAILKWIYGISPALYIDTLGMCRATMPEAKGASLEVALRHIGAPPKGDALKHAMGLRLADLRRMPDYYDRYQRYAERDCDGSVWLFQHLAHHFAGSAGTGTIHGNEEFVVMDLVARMAIDPQMALDVNVLPEYHRKVVANKERLVHALADSGILDESNPRGTLMSNEKFADALRKLGIEPPVKWSAKQKKETYAFSKTDDEFVELLDDEDPLVQAAVAARLGVKSTLEETRAQRFINISRVQWPLLPRDFAPPPMPFPLKFSGAHTHRLSGDWYLNLQNLGRKSELRRALIAPPGYEIVSADASQIEARIVSWVAGAVRLLTAFRDKLDPYALLASSVYGYPVDKRIHIGERFVGKTAVLGLGFGMGAPKFKVTCLNQGRAQKMPIELCRIDEELAGRTVKVYRTENKEIPAYWKRMDEAIYALSTRQTMRIGVLIVDGPTQSIILPNGMRLYYHDMHQEQMEAFEPGGRPRNQWVFRYGREVKFTFGGKMTENVVQALARIITMHSATRIRASARIGAWRPTLAGQVHDQLIYVVPTEIAHDFKNLLVAEMATSRDWYADLPLDAEGAVGANLLDAK